LPAASYPATELPPAGADEKHGRINAAVDHLRTALALWRGPVLCGISSPALQPEITCWEERRFSITEQCLALELRLGRHQDLISELSAFVADHPLRERPRALLMLALYRTGGRPKRSTAGVTDEPPSPPMRASEQGDCIPFSEPGLFIRRTRRWRACDEHGRAQPEQPFVAVLAAALLVSCTGGGAASPARVAQSAPTVPRRRPQPVPR